MVRAKTVAAFLMAITSISIPALHGQTDWPEYGHDPGGMRYSPLKQITPANVATLARAWTYDTSEGSKRPRAEEVTPLVVNDVMYVPSSFGRVVALSRKREK